MQGAVNFFRGKVRLTVRMAYPERLINICAENGIEFWNAESGGDGVLTITVPLSDCRRLERLQKQGGFTILRREKAGVPVTAGKIRKRYVLIAGLFLCLGLLLWSSLYVWDIQVDGNTTVSDEEILSELRRLGVRVGMCRLDYNQSRVSNEMLLRLTKLSWLTVNIRGSRAYVLVREETEAPERENEKRDTVVYAAKPGIITGIVARSGRTLVAVGDTVAAGDLLVTGEMDSASCGVRYVNAEAEIRARTWYELSACAPASWQEREYTGASTVRYALVLGETRVNLYFNGGNPYACCDKIVTERNVTLPGGSVLPIRVIREEYRECRETAARPDAAGLSAAMEQYLTGRLRQSIDGEIRESSFRCSVEEGTVYVTGVFECDEQIGRTRDLTEQDLQLPPSGADNTDRGETDGT